MVNVLVLCDSPWHPAEVIELGLSRLEGNEFHFTYIKDAKDILTPSFIVDFPLIVCCKGDNVSEANSNPWFEEGVTEVGPKEFEDYIKNGGGFLAVHAGTLGRENTPYSSLTGCVFHGHPPRCEVDVKITGTHPIVKDITDFRIRDEHYQISVTAADATELFYTVSESGGKQVAGYVREIGGGRLCVLTPGHCLGVFLNPSYQSILLNSMRWCKRK